MCEHVIQRGPNVTVLKIESMMIILIRLRCHREATHFKLLLIRITIYWTTHDENLELPFEPDENFLAAIFSDCGQTKG